MEKRWSISYDNNFIDNIKEKKRKPARSTIYRKKMERFRIARGRCVYKKIAQTFSFILKRECGREREKGT